MELTPVIEQSFIQYSGSVIQSRALVDVRDCIKPSARQIFYSMYRNKYTHDKPYEKTNAPLGDATKDFYIHGNSSCVGIMMRAAQPFAMRYPLCEVKGNYGTLMATENWAAERYTSTRLSAISANLFEDIQKDVISKDEWRDNYADNLQYPSVLPSKGFYNIVNGTLGIGVGMAGSIPQFNLIEVNNALIYLLQNPNCSFEEIYCPPDFATGALLLNEKEVKETLKAGNKKQVEDGEGGACKLRSVIEYDVSDHCLVVKEIPYGVYTNTICKQLEAIIESEDNPGIDRFNDLTGKEVNIKIYLHKGINPDKVIRYLYKNSSLQYYYSINMTMLDKGRFPKVFTWKEALQAHIDHEKIVYRNGFNYDLNKIKHRIHILDGLLICLASIDEVVRVIKSSASAAAASVTLQKQFLLDEEQAKAVLDMKLARLANLEVKKLENEKAELEAEQKRIEAILNSEELFNAELIKGWQDVTKRYGDARRTKIVHLAEEDENGELQDIVAENCIVVLTEGNTLKRIPTKNFAVQKRNGKGIKNQEDITSMIIRTNTLDNLMIFTNRGNMYRLLVDEIPEGTNQSKGYPIDALVSMQPEEQAQVIYSIYRDTNAQYIFFVTKQGIVKKTALEEYVKTKKKNGISAINLRQDDSLASAFLVKDEDVILLTRNGYGIKIASKEVAATGRVTMGVKGITLGQEDEVVCALPIRDTTDYLAVFAEQGTAKKFPVKDIVLQNRGGRGLIYSKELAATACLISDNDTVLVVGNKSSICIAASEIPIGARTIMGNQIIKGNKVIGVSKV